MSDRLYDIDYYAWTQEQAAALREAAALARTNSRVDYAHLAEEVEDFGRGERYTVESHLETVLHHLLKLALSPAAEPRRGWEDSVAHARDELERRLTTTLRTHLASSFPRRYAVARRAAVRGLAADGIPPEAVPTTCPYTLDQALDHDWWPANRHG